MAQTPVELPEEKPTEVLKVVDALEQDDDVQHVFHALALKAWTQGVQRPTRAVKELAHSTVATCRAASA